jgi:hypothetical protein
MKKVMIIDGLNMFLRSYIVVPSMDKTAHQTEEPMAS